ncbi:MAG TPA: carbohydrate ABC transporter permease [Candidatus Dormibacteraeota bacterium]
MSIATPLAGTNAPIVAAEEERRPQPDTTERTNQLEAVVRYILYGIITLFLFIPFAMTVLSSFKTSAEVIAFPPTLLPSVWHPENYLRVFTETQNFPRQVFNGFFVTLIVVALNLFFDALVGYAFARLEFPFKNLLFALMIGTMVIPGFVFFVPRFIMLQHAGLINTYGALPVLYFVQPAYILLMTQFFKSIPKELEEAAIMDGLGWFGIFWKIVMPLARPALLATGILTFAGMWNNFLDWLIYMQTSNMFNIQLGLATFRSVYQNQWDLIMAGSVIAILPILIVYVAGQRYFVRGIATTGLK